MRLYGLLVGSLMPTACFIRRAPQSPINSCRLNISEVLPAKNSCEREKRARKKYFCLDIARCRKKALISTYFLVLVRVIEW